MAAVSVNIADVGHAIQLALAPVFLLTGIAGILGVMAGRLARIIDRGRKLTEGARPIEAAVDGHILLELQSLDRRRHLASSAITACTFSALVVCTVIAALFLEVLLQVEIRWLIGLLFTSATLALITGLAFFLREVHLATRTVRIPTVLAQPAALRSDRA
jgi:hypothetical protein